MGLPLSKTWVNSIFWASMRMLSTTALTVNSYFTVPVTFRFTGLSSSDDQQVVKSTDLGDWATATAVSNNKQYRSSIEYFFNPHKYTQTFAAIFGRSGFRDFKL